MKKRNKIGYAALALTGILATTSFAQRAKPTQDDRQQQREDQRDRIRNMSPEDRAKYFQERMQERMKNMTPEQRQQMQERMQQFQQMMGGATGATGTTAPAPQMSVEDARRALLNSALITDRATQDAIIAFVDAQDKRRAALTQKALALNGALADESVRPSHLSALLDDLHQATKDEQAQNKDGLAELDTKIQYSTTPRLEAFLTLIGVLGDDANLAGGFGAIFPTGVAGGAQAKAALEAAPSKNIAPTAPTANIE